MKYIDPNWPAPNNIRAFTSTREGGGSYSPFHSLNLGSHVNDNLDHVIENRKRIQQDQHIPNQPIWLNQTHSTNVINIPTVMNDALSYQGVIDTDASYTNHPHQVSVVLTADCLPVLFCSTAGNEVASAHAGWRGLCYGILENTVSHFKCPKSEILAWLGPAIGPQAFEVGLDVKEQFLANDPNAASAFTLINAESQKYLADLYLLAKQRLIKLGITQVYGGEYCTYYQHDLFYSYRRDQCTGRMASMIWFE